MEPLHSVHSCEMSQLCWLCRFCHSLLLCHGRKSSASHFKTLSCKVLPSASEFIKIEWKKKVWKVSNDERNAACFYTNWPNHSKWQRVTEKRDLSFVFLFFLPFPASSLIITKEGTTTSSSNREKEWKIWSIIICHLVSIVEFLILFSFQTCSRWAVLLFWWFTKKRRAVGSLCLLVISGWKNGWQKKKPLKLCMWNDPKKKFDLRSNTGREKHKVQTLVFGRYVIEHFYYYDWQGI